MHNRNIDVLKTGTAKKTGNFRLRESKPHISVQFASLVGFAFTLFGVGVLAFVVGKYLIQGTNVPGFPFLASVIAIFSGAQLFALGIIGEYLARIHFRMMQRPAYQVHLATDTRSDLRAAAGTALVAFSE